MREIGQPIDDPRDAAEPSGPPSEEEMRETMEIIGRYMDVLPPDATPK